LAGYLGPSGGQGFSRKEILERQARMPGLRISATVLRQLSAGILALALFLGLVIPASADTGTYGISSYIITLEPQSSGQVKITVDQQWKVLSGDIPWITVGLPNDHYSIGEYSGAASKVSSANGGGFSGVRVDLDKDYQPGQSFEIKFSVLQENLLERLTADKKWRINYTPGWYDRAAIDLLQIVLLSPVDYQTYSSLGPLPDRVNGNTITWERFNLAPGSRFALNFESLDGNFLAASVPVKQSQGPFSTTFFVIIGIVVVIGLAIFLIVRRNKQAQEEALKNRVVVIEEEMARDKKKKAEVEQGFEEYVEKKNLEPDAEGRYYDRSYGNYITPAIWAAIIAGQAARSDQNSSGSSRPYSSCACACVSCACACACACAGGGAAGCSKKSLHECSACSPSRVNPLSQAPHK
jgi:LPXTG-motif cell wall-anchored protein